MGYDACQFKEGWKTSRISFFFWGVLDFGLASETVRLIHHLGQWQRLLDSEKLQTQRQDRSLCMTSIQHLPFC